MPRSKRRRTSRKTPVHARRDPARHARRPQHQSLRSATSELFAQTDSDASPLTAQRGLGHHPATAACVALLLGATTAMVVAGLNDRLGEGFRGGIPAGSTISGAALVALAIGVRVPQRFALWLCTKAWRRLMARGRSPLLADVLLTSGSSDRPLYWSVVSVVALTAGVLAALTPLYVRVALYFMTWMQSRFLWAGATLAMLHFLTASIAILAPLTAMGLAISGAHRLSGRRGQWDTRATAYAAFGVAAGLLVATGLAAATVQADIVLVAAALPTLLAAVLAAVASTAKNEQPGGEPEVQPACLPLWSDRWPALLRGSLVALGAASAWALSAWSMNGPSSGWGRSTLGPALFMALGSGVLGGCRQTAATTRTIGGFGVACAAAGVITALGVFATWIAGRAAFVAAMFFACACAGAVGFAMAYGRQSLLVRVASRTSEGAKILARMLTGAALAAWIAAPALSRFLGADQALVLLALALIALGGTLIIHEPDEVPRTRRQRLCAVFASIGLMILMALLAPVPRAPDAPGPLATPLPRKADLGSHGLASLRDDR